MTCFFYSNCILKDNIAYIFSSKVVGNKCQNPPKYQAYVPSAWDLYSTLSP